MREDLSSLPPEEQPLASWPGGRVGGLYDATGLFVAVVRRLQANIGPNRASVAPELRETELVGATGLISFTESRIANNRKLAILTIRNGRELEEADGIPQCAMMSGTLYSLGQARQPDGCPQLQQDR